MKYILGSLLLMGALGLAGCASPTLKAPCPNYGDSCHKTPVNSWDYSNH